jgi:hypothetical protein
MIQNGIINLNISQEFDDPLTITCNEGVRIPLRESLVNLPIASCLMSLTRRPASSVSSKFREQVGEP